MELGNATELGGPKQFGVLLAVSCSIVLFLFVLLVYLVYLRRIRIKAEEWLKEHEHILFSHAKNIKSPEEILTSLVEHAKLGDFALTRNKVIAKVGSSQTMKEAAEGLLDG